MIKISILLLSILVSAGISADHTVYWCAYSDDLTVFHIGVADSGLTVTTGQPNFEAFDVETDEDDDPENDIEDYVDNLMGEGYYAVWKEEHDI